MPKEEKFKNPSDAGSSKPYDRPPRKTETQKAEDVLAYRLSRMNLDITSRDQQVNVKSKDLPGISVTSITEEHIRQALEKLVQERTSLEEEIALKISPKQIIEWSEVLNKCNDALKKISLFSNELEKIGSNPQRVQLHWERLERTDNPYLSTGIVRIKNAVSDESLNKELSEMQINEQ